MADLSPLAKQHTTGTHRLVPPEETVARVRPFLREMGITRVADVTGLDTIGIPVVMVTRPNARSLSVSQGKGLTLAAARASGLMESVEHWHAERVDLPLRLASLREMCASCRVIDVSALPRLSISTFHDHLRTLWIEGTDLAGGQPTWAPYEMVHTCYSLPLPPGSGSFLMSSSGLASGNHLLEATNHAVCELIERDAATLFVLSSDAERRRRRVDLATVDDPACRQLLGLYSAAGIEVFAWEATSDVGVPTFLAAIVDSEPHPGRPIGPMRGLGCHPSRAVALLRALTEAAQSRLTMITGSRDDVTHGQPGAAAALESARATLARCAEEPAGRSFLDAPTFEGESFDADLAWLLGRLAARGLTEVVRVDLTRPAIGIPVVRVLVPGLEPLHDVPGYVPGRRARELLDRQ